MITRKPVPNPGQSAPNEWSLQESENPDGSDKMARIRPDDNEGGPESIHSQAPHALRPGPDNISEPEENVWRDGATLPRPAFSDVPESLTPSGRSRSETNPFLKAQITGSTVGESSPLQPPVPPQPPPLSVSLPTQAFSQMGIGEQSNNPWQPALDEVGLSPSAQIPSTQIPSQSAQDAQDQWASHTIPRHTAACTGLKSPALISLASSDDAAAWEEEAPNLRHPPMPVPANSSDTIFEDSHAWEEAGHKEKGKGRAMDLPPLDSGPVDEWRAMDEESTPKALGVQPNKETKPPDLPPRKQNAPAEPSLGESEAKFGETYQIKVIKWFDATATDNPRKSPILLQNENGPCPLVALVNALSLSTTADDEDVMLVQMLKSREHVSLQLLVDGVIDELMAGDRLGPDVTLPDMSDFYAFLKGLHTGMNVDPRFIPTDEDVKALKRTSRSHIHPHEREELIPGTFEGADELDLYAVFGIPLLHGWLPARNEAAYQAFERRARSYEDAQRLLCGEEELERKLTSSYEALTDSEQQVYQDMLTIRTFLLNWSNQITPWGVEVITQTMQPGSVAILFRNNHFTTLYCHPQTLQLMALVTDAGYASHEDVVWESLVDVNGEHAEFFSGDFRVVGGATTGSNDSGASVNGSGLPPAADRSEWPELGASGTSGAQGGRQTAAQQTRGGRSSQQATEPDRAMSPSVQEDADLALAIQLQEEEDQRAREERARRQREAHLTEQFIEQQHRKPNLVIPDRRTSSPAMSSTYGSGSAHSVASPQGLRRPSHGLASQRSQQQVRPLVPPASPSVSQIPQQQTSNVRLAVHRPADEGAEDAPPSYEQASMTKAWVPPVGHPSHQSSPVNARTSRQSFGLEQSHGGASQSSASQNGASQSSAGNQGFANQAIATNPAVNRPAPATARFPIQQPVQTQGAMGRGARMPMASPGDVEYEQSRDERCLLM